MKTKLDDLRNALALLTSRAVFTFNFQSTGLAFERRLNATITRSGQSGALLLTVATNCLRVEMTGTNWANPVDIVDRNSGALMLLSPRNRSFVRFGPAVDNSSTPPGVPQMPSGVPPVPVRSRNLPVRRQCPVVCRPESDRKHNHRPCQKGRPAEECRACPRCR